MRLPRVLAVAALCNLCSAVPIRENRGEHSPLVITSPDDGHSDSGQLVIQQANDIEDITEPARTSPLVVKDVVSTGIDVPAELRRLGLDHLDLGRWNPDVDMTTLRRQYARLQALPPDSSYREKAHALACLVALSDTPHDALLWELEWDIFYTQYLSHLSATDPETRKVIEYYRVRLLRAHRSASARAPAVASLVDLAVLHDT